ncbi:hypothetical protein LTS18_013249, partial [Coniosporium uncinatum]
MTMSQLKRGLPSSDDSTVDIKKPRRSSRIKSQAHEDVVEGLKNSQLPSPLTHKESTATEDARNGTVTPPSQMRPHPVVSSPVSDTQPFSQFVYPPAAKSYEVEDEEGEGVWGYLVPSGGAAIEPLVLRRRAACPVPPNRTGQTDGKKKVSKNHYKKQEEDYEKEKVKAGVVAGGYLIGRHPEC